jgi:hypothetical protein
MPVREMSRVPGSRDATHTSRTMMMLWRREKFQSALRTKD